MSLNLKLEGFDETSEIPPGQTYTLLPENAPLSNEVWSAGTVIIEIAGQIPYSHPAQLKLATLVEHLSKAEKFIDKPDEKRIRYSCQRLKEALRDSYNGPNDEIPTEWPSLNAFYTHLDARHVFNNHPTYMIWTMRSAFEENAGDDPEYFSGMKDQCVLAAAQYILWSGQEQFKRIGFSGDIDEDLLRDWKPGPLYDGKAAFGLERWRFWKAGFMAAAEDFDLGKEARDVADRAAGLMDALENALLFRLAGSAFCVP
ncbi:hypothetical protein BJX68DRAFT_266656 [Aspergillus pseudodeflectus]|uniref:Protein kinase domain-containing protein n=1 Tax=Aspergillus pseudodeflectus TaxID=176178 RepID=A0ABR4KDT8_9EURO